ncbi:hypothetical protein QEN19_003491 [Hanseniaspora menglaensis]
MNENMKIGTISNINSFAKLINIQDTNSASSSETTNSLQSLNNDNVNKYEETEKNQIINSNIKTERYLNYINSQSSGLVSIIHDSCSEKETTPEEDSLNHNKNLETLHQEISLIDVHDYKFPFSNNDNQAGNIDSIDNNIITDAYSLKNIEESATQFFNIMTEDSCENDIVKNTTSKKSNNNQQHLNLTKTSNEVTNSNVSEGLESLLSRKEASECRSSALLLPKYETIKMYKKNLEKSKDPVMLFEYVEYLLQTCFEIRNDDPELSNKLIKESCHYLKKLSVKGHSNAQYLLADIYSTELIGQPNYKKALVLFQMAAKHGHIESAFRTAECYEKGLGCPRDSRKSIEFLKFASSRNHNKSMLKLGLFLFNGKMGFKKHYRTQQNGINWISRATAKADKNCPDAPYELAKIYEKGFLDIIIADFKYALNLYIQSASLGHTKSKTKLAQIYENGVEDILPNKLLSIHYFTEASEATDPDPQAQLKLCSWYLSGVEGLIERDLEESFFWAQKAANLNFSKAQFTLGNFYEKGVGCQTDNKLAHDWYAKAANNGYKKADEKLQKLAKELNIDEQDVNIVTEEIAETSLSNLKISKIFSNNDSITTSKHTHRSTNSLFSFSKIFGSIDSGDCDLTAKKNGGSAEKQQNINNFKLVASDTSETWKKSFISTDISSKLKTPKLNTKASQKPPNVYGLNQASVFPSQSDNNSYVSSLEMINIETSDNKLKEGEKEDKFFKSKRLAKMFKHKK